MAESRFDLKKLDFEIDCFQYLEIEEHFVTFL